MPPECRMAWIFLWPSRSREKADLVVPYGGPSFMRCPSCGADHSFKECPPQAAVAASALALSTQELEPDPLDLEDENTEMTGAPLEARPASRLIEFPGVTRRAVPQWRKELSERVREVQERRAR